MRVFLGDRVCVVEREPGDRVPRGGSWGSAESQLWGWIRDALRARGHDVVRRRMQSDGHMYGDERLPYIRDRRWAFFVYDGHYAVRSIVDDFAGGGVRLMVQRNGAVGEG